MLWTADSVYYRDVSMGAAYSGDTLIWIKNKPSGGIWELLDVVNYDTELNSGDTVLFMTIGSFIVPGGGGFVSTEQRKNGDVKHFYNAINPRDNISYEGKYVYITGSPLTTQISNSYLESDFKVVEFTTVAAIKAPVGGSYFGWIPEDQGLQYLTKVKIPRNSSSLGGPYNGDQWLFYHDSYVNPSRLSDIRFAGQGGPVSSSSYSNYPIHMVRAIRIA